MAGRRHARYPGAAGPRSGEDGRARLWEPAPPDEERAMSTIGAADPEVRVSTGRLRGRVEDGVAVFRGVPFARPPVGALRLAAPVPAEPWDGVREAGAFGPPPPQSRLLGASRADGGDGDWLTLNVWSPTSAPPGCR
ncbi:carboxylesterase family protein [Nonomuraea rubra]|uniref:carboxylesterase family protein n=1 Tax=Nonomuraea rubra TaxID=46180 RepID=UPI00360EEA5F